MNSEIGMVTDTALVLHIKQTTRRTYIIAQGTLQGRKSKGR